MSDWFEEYDVLLGWLFGLSLLMLVGGAIAVPIVVARIPEDYFLRRRPAPGSWRGQHPLARWSGLVVKNVLGGGLVAAGVAMLVLPGQGVLTILVGLTLMNFPGKRRFLLWLVRRRPLLRAINWIRAMAGRPSLRLPERARRRRGRKPRSIQG